MTQSRSLMALISGTLIILNVSSAFGLILYGLSVFMLSNKAMVASPFAVLGELVLSLILQIFCALLGTVFWKIRLDDQRPDLLLAVHRSIVALTTCHLVHFIASGFFSPYVFNKSLLLISFIPCALVSAYLLYKFFLMDILSDRSEIVRAALILDVVALYHLLTDFWVKFNVRQDLFNTASPILILKASDDHNLSLVSSMVILVILAGIFYFWLTPNRRPATRTTPKDKSVEKKVGDKEEEKDEGEESYGDVLSRDRMNSLHTWNMVAALVALTGPPSCLVLLLSAAVFIGAAIKPKVLDGKADIFYRLAAGQKREEADY